MKSLLYLFILFAIIFVVVSVWMFVFNIYAVEYRVFSNGVNIKAESKIKFQAVPLNSFGKAVPFRDVDFIYELEGLTDAQIISTTQNFVVVKLNSSFAEKKIKIKFKSKYDRDFVVKPIW